MDVQQLRHLVGGWPGVGEDIKWGADLCLLVDAKMFCVTGLDGGALTIKVDPERFLELTELPGVTPAPYLARAKWVRVEAGALPADDRDALIRRSYELVRAGLGKARQRALSD
ncbi:MAG: MmcQ/YjbR family DNA-binding protein [Pseudoxanthomonas suwonensis]|nr:MmcQ/YjbR family DNA-binding protein [Pseudoxanthomonas suwonensis]